MSFPPTLFGIAAAGAFALFIAIVASFPLLYDYRIESDAIAFVLLRMLPVYRIRFSNISTIAIVPWMSFKWDIALSLGNRPFRPCVLIKQGGLLRRVYITPKDADAFVAAVKSKIMGVD
jgi:hypothetical protein